MGDELLLSIKLGPRQYCRLQERIPLRCWVTVLYFDSLHVRRSLLCRARNVSASGMLVESINALQAGSIVYVRPKDWNFLLGVAHVRRCDRRGWKYRIGVKYCIPLKKRF